MERFTTTQKCSDNGGKKSMHQTCTIWLLNWRHAQRQAFPACTRRSVLELRVTVLTQSYDP
jgi:hypothetical protein